jgi:hypothetical protein
LLDNGADKNAKDLHGATPLNDAVREGYDSVVSWQYTGVCTLYFGLGRAQVFLLQEHDEISSVSPRKHFDTIRSKGKKVNFAGAMKAGPEGLNMARALRDMKRNLFDLHRGLTMLHSFSVINKSGFRKIVKKYDKSLAWSSM